MALVVALSPSSCSGRIFTSAKCKDLQYHIGRKLYHLEMQSFYRSYLFKSRDPSVLCLFICCYLVPIDAGDVISILISRQFFASAPL